MIIYNVTITIDEEVHQEWLRWMQQEHIPAVMATGLFTGHRLVRVITDGDETTYAVQYECADMASYERYRDEHAARLQAETHSRYEGRFAAFRTLLQEVDRS